MFSVCTKLPDYGLPITDYRLPITSTLSPSLSIALTFLAAYVVVSVATILFVPTATENLRRYPVLWLVPILNALAVANIDEIGMGACRMIDKGYRNGWGFGRHVIGSNFFHYLRDPWGSLVEYFCDIDYIPDGFDWKPKDYPAADSLYAWGPSVPDDFGVNFEVRD